MNVMYIFCGKIYHRYTKKARFKEKKSQYNKYEINDKEFLITLELIRRLYFMFL